MADPSLSLPPELQKRKRNLKRLRRLYYPLMTGILAFYVVEPPRNLIPSVFLATGVFLSMGMVLLEAVVSRLVAAHWKGEAEKKQPAYYNTIGVLTTTGISALVYDSDGKEVCYERVNLTDQEER